MKTMIDKETADIEANGLDLTNGHNASVVVLRSQLDGKWPKFLAGLEVHPASSVLPHSNKFMM